MYLFFKKNQHNTAEQETLDDEPRPEGTGYRRSVRNGLYAVPIPKHSNINIGSNRPKGRGIEPACE